MVGPLEVNYRPLVIGSGRYRGDSFLCASAIHAGVTTDRKGGCGRISLLGRQEHFASTESHGIQSIAYDSYFPKSFSVSSNDGFPCWSDPRSLLLSVSLLCTFALVVLFTSPKVFYPISAILFAHVSFISDPPQASYHNITVLPDHLSMFAKRILPASFVAIFIYRTVVKDTLSHVKAPLERALFWLGGFWTGALSNYSFDWIPIARLTAHDLEQQPGAKVALGVILVLLSTIVVSQAYFLWLEGRLAVHLRLYGCFIASIILCLIIPGVHLRLHHYILALLLLPGTRLQTRPSLVYQGILLGLSVNGIARWDFDSVLQTSEALRADAKLGSVSPRILDPVMDTSAGSIVATFHYGEPPTWADGVSVLVNDVERSRVFVSEWTERALPFFAWTRSATMEEKEYFRFAYMMDGKTLDYSKAGTLHANGSWSGSDSPT